MFCLGGNHAADREMAQAESLRPRSGRDRELVTTAILLMRSEPAGGIYGRIRAYGIGMWFVEDRSDTGGCDAKQHRAAHCVTNTRPVGMKNG